MKVQIFPSAFEDMQGILEWYASQSVPEVGQHFVFQIFEPAETLAGHPSIGRVVPEYSDANIRELIHPPFRVIYQIYKSLIAVIRIWRSERILQLP